MKVPVHYILSRKTMRGAALTVASFSVVSSSFAIADGATPPAVPSAYSVDSASNTLAAILKDAQEKGFVRTKDQEGAIPQQTKSPALTVASPKNAKEDIGPVSCATAERLNFSDLESFESYEDLTFAKAKYDPNSIPGDAEDLARVYIALALGDEALGTLHAETSVEANLLMQVAQIISYPEKRPIEKVLSEYKGCDGVASIWAYLEDPAQFTTPFTMTEIRDMVYMLETFPPILKEQMMKSLTIASAETGQTDFANYLLERLENIAMEEGRPLPQDRESDFEYIYLSALMERETNPSAAIAKFNYLSERGSVYRANSVKYIAQIRSGEGVSLGSTLEADLKEVSERSKETTGSQDAAYQLILGQLNQGRLNDSIHSAQSFLDAGSTEYALAQSEVSAVLMAHFQSESQSVQATALDTFLKQSDFLKTTAEWEDLKSGAFATSLVLDLPELVAVIQTNGAALSQNQAQSLEKARLLLALKAKTFTTSDYTKLSSGVRRGLERNIMDYALINSNLDLAKQALGDMEKSEDKTSYEMNLAWLEQDWAKAHTLSGDQIETKNATVDTDVQTTKSPEPISQAESSILTVLTKPALTVPSFKGSKWRANLSAELTEMEDQIKISKAFLNHG